MNKIFLIAILLFMPGSIFADEILESFEEENLPVLNEELRKIKKGGIELGIIRDNDGDTKIQVEESADEDAIRFDTAGTERFIIDSTGITLPDDLPLNIGTGAPASLLWETADGNAHCVVLILPEGGGATDVPVFVIGDATIKGDDLATYDTEQHPTLVIYSDGGTARVTLRHDGSNSRLYSSAGDIILHPVGNEIVPNADADVSLGTDALGFLNLKITGAVFVDDVTGVSGTYPIYNDGTSGNLTQIVVNGGVITGATVAP